MLEPIPCAQVKLTLSLSLRCQQPSAQAEIQSTARLSIQPGVKAMLSHSSLHNLNSMSQVAQSSSMSAA